MTSQRLAAAPNEPQNWLTYSGGYYSQRYSPLNQITPANVKNLKLQWVYQSPVAGNWQTTPLVVDGVMYLTQRLNDVVALDPVTGRVFWMYRYTPAQDRIVCCGANNRGLAILGNTLFMGTLDAQLIAIDARSGRPIWKTEVATTKDGYSITHAPLVVKDKVIVGVGGGEYGIRGFIAAYDAATGKEAWRFYTIPAPGEPGSETWQACPPKGANTFCDPDAWKHGGGSIWMTGSYDPQLNLTYWGVGNVGPDYNGAQRPGDNLYTDSVVALDVDTGKLRWHYQFTPHDVYDYDSVQVPGADRQLGRQSDERRRLGQPQRQLLRARSGHRTVSRGRAVREGQLDEPVRRARPSHADAAAGRTTDLPGQSGRNELVLAVVQPAHRACSTSRPGKTTRASTRRRRRSTRSARTSSAAVRAICRLCLAHRVSADRRSTPGPRRPVTARSSRSIPGTGGRSGSSR